MPDGSRSLAYPHHGHARGHGGAGGRAETTSTRGRPPRSSRREAPGCPRRWGRTTPTRARRCRRAGRQGARTGDPAGRRRIVPAAAVATLGELSGTRRRAGPHWSAAELPSQAVELIEKAGLEQHLSLVGHAAAARVAVHNGNQGAGRHAGRRCPGTKTPSPAAFPWLSAQVVGALGQIFLDLGDHAAARFRAGETRAHLTGLLTEALRGAAGPARSPHNPYQERHGADQNRVGCPAVARPTSPSARSATSSTPHGTSPRHRRLPQAALLHPHRGGGERPRP